MPVHYYWEYIIVIYNENVEYSSGFQNSKRETMNYYISYNDIDYTPDSPLSIIANQEIKIYIYKETTSLEYFFDKDNDEKAENIIRVDPPLSIDDRPIRDVPDFQSCAQNNFIIKLDHKEIPLTEQIIVYRCQVQPSSIDKAKDIVATISFENGLISAIISDCDALKTIAFAIQRQTNRIVPKAAQYIFKVSSSEQPSLFEFIENAEDNSILVNNTANSVLTVLESAQAGSAIIMQDSDSICDKTGKVVLSIHKVEPAIVDDPEDLGGWGDEW